MIESFFVLIALILTGFTSYTSKSLTRSGAAAAILIGAAVYIGFGVAGLSILGIFFATSNFWSKYKNKLKLKMEEKLAKGATRDWRQVVANGGSAAIASILFHFDHSSIWMIAFSVSIASANSDTWASEIGSLSRKDPIYIRTFRRTEKGTSGAISLLGSFAAVSGSLLIASVCWWLFHLENISFYLIFLFGFVGNVIDTLIGAFYQQMFFCKVCEIETERKVHCQKPTIQMKGYSYIDNDMVNFLSGALAVLLNIVVLHLIN